MKIGFDISQTGLEKAGCGYFAYSLIQALGKMDTKNKYFLYPSFGEDYWGGKIPNPVQPLRRWRFPLTLSHLSVNHSQNFWRNPPDNLESHLRHPDLIHSNNFYTPTTLHHARLVYTLYDISFFENPEWHTVNNWAVVSKGIFNAAIHADGMIAISEYSKKHFLEYFPHYPADRIWVAHLASRFPLPGKKSIPPAHVNLPANQFWLSVGTLEPRKNHTGLLNAYAAQTRTVPETYPLVLVGARGWKSEHLQTLAADLGIKDKVIILGYVEDETLQWLYENCYAFIYPSFFEGFGLPVLEAFSMGAAVVTSNTTSLPEVAGDAAWMVDPTNQAEIISAIQRLQADPALRASLRERAKLQAAKFSWQKTARNILDVYNQVLSLPKLRRSSAANIEKFH